MPSSLVEVRRRYTPAEEVAIIDAIHGALVAAFQIPSGNKHVRLVAHEPHRFSHTSTLEKPELFTLVSIDCFAGRSLQAKRNLYGEIVGRLATFGIPRDHVTILLRESETENWGIDGGHAACDIDRDFKVDV